MQNLINKYIISINAYALHFVKNFWLNDGHHSENYKVSSAFTTLLIIHYAWLYFINNFLPFNWKAVLFFICCFHLLVAVLFNHKITAIINQPKPARFMRYYLFFILYLSIGVILLFIDIFYI